ncbi:TolC family protein [Desulfoluna spongiiphila]|uniref:Outer membrane protein TolC n=1 Tax=Desulfoluna spongiiphila TaxID=419481 RepID=A0A1G5G9B3_9BACT|nr:TolC family protein [Desulfoluna spongiiphila]SCY47889.1 Outer membrane protein TolC [Desulfoluna spongiiphila]
MDWQRRFAGAWLVLLSVAFLWTAVGTAGELTLDEALSSMEAGNDTLAAAREAKAAKEYEKEAAFGLHLPTVAATMRWTRIDEPIEIDLSGIHDAMSFLHGPNPITGSPGDPRLAYVPAFTMPVQNDTFVKGRITASLPLYAGGRIQAANQAASSRVQEAGAQLRATGNRLMRDMVTRYYGLRFAKKVVEVRASYLEGMEQHVSEARQLEAQGMISRSERLHAEVARAEADRLLKRSVRDQAIAETALVNLLAGEEGVHGTIHPVSPLFLTRDIEPMDYFVSAALRLNPMLQQIDEKGVQARAGVKAEKGTLLPKVYLFARQELVTDDLTMLEPEWAAGVGMEMSLFEGFSSVNRLRSARVRTSQVAHISAQAKKDIATLTEKLYHEVVAQLEQHDALKTSRALAEEAVRVQTRAFEEGYATSLDVVDARLTLSGVEIEQLQAVYGYDVALARLLETAGLATAFHTYRNDKEQEVTF